ncbi:hypothetical protein GCM10009087_39320 [Sphingomonas oligophenolica]|uniref:Cache domain-containing protein n=1 Tax=Sphingomonas oligophenolica TaxID=301154 RepID=A0ABU9Y2E2_9SPHN
MLRPAFPCAAFAACLALSSPGFASSPGPAKPARPVAAFKVDGTLALAAYQAMVEEHLAGVLRSIKALAVTSDARSGDWARIRPALERLSADLPTAATISYVQPDGSYATTAIGQSPDNLSDRAYFPGLMAGKDVVGSLVVSKATGHRSIVVATPVMRDGKVVAAIGVTLRARLISQLVTDHGLLPADLTFYALDSTGKTAIHKDPDLMFAFPSDMGDSSLKAAVKTILGQREGVVHYRFRNDDRTAIFRTSDATGWRFVLVRVGR